MTMTLDIPRLPAGLHAFLIAIGLALMAGAGGAWSNYAMQIELRLDAQAREDLAYWHAWEVFDDARVARGWEGSEVRHWEREQLRALRYRAESSRLEASLIVRDAERAWVLVWPAGAVVLLGMVLVLSRRRLWAERDLVEKAVLLAGTREGSR